MTKPKEYLSFNPPRNQTLLEEIMENIPGFIRLSCFIEEHRLMRSDLCNDGLNLAQ